MTDNINETADKILNDLKDRVSNINTDHLDYHRYAKANLETIVEIAELFTKDHDDYKEFYKILEDTTALLIADHLWNESIKNKRTNTDEAVWNFLTGIFFKASLTAKASLKNYYESEGRV